MTAHRPPLPPPPPGSDLGANPGPDSGDPGPLVAIGRVTRAHGLQGEVCLNYYAQSLEWLDSPIWLRAGDTEPAGKARVEGMRLHRGQVLIRLEGVADRNAAERLRGLTVLMPRSMLPESGSASESGPESEKDAPYLHDMLGMGVLLHATGEPIGELSHVDFIGGQELWVIAAPDGREILFPAVPDFVNAVDLEGRIIRISPPSGLLDLYAAPR